MNTKIKQLYTNKLVMALFVALSVLSFVTIISPRYVSAQNSENCTLKIDKDACLKAIEQECKNRSGDQLGNCQARVARELPDVMNACKEVDRPRACHQKASQECDGKTGDARTECRQKIAAGFKKQTGAPANFFGSNNANNQHQCGSGSQAVTTKINFGCIGGSVDAPENLSPIVDLLFALVRFLSAGVGVILIASIVLAGIQYSTSEGSPEATQAAKDRIRSAIIGLLIYIFAFSFIQFLVPGGIFN